MIENRLEELILEAQLWESRTIERQALLIADLQQEISDLKAINRILLGKVSENDDPRTVSL